MAESISKKLDAASKEQDRNEQQDKAPYQNVADPLQLQGNPIEEPVAPEGPTLLPGGVPVPDGYTHVGTIPNDDGSIRINVANLKDQVDVDEINGASIKLDRGAENPKVGFLHGRIIHDFHAFLHIFRKDYPTENRTHFKVDLGHGSGTSV